MAYPNYAGTQQSHPPASDYPAEPATDSSRINQISGRLKYCQEIAGNIAVNVSCELDRILGSAPQPPGADNVRAIGPSGSVNQMDDLVSGLLETLERLSNQTQRLSSI